MNHSIAILTIALAISGLAGCAGSPERFPDHRGVRIPSSDVPDAVLREFNRRGSKIRNIERVDDGALFRFETESGSIIFLDGTGRWQGTVI